MKNLFRRFLAVFLCLALMVPLATVGVWAEESANECAATVTIQNEGTVEFATAREAWDFVNRNTDSTLTMTLNKDWVAENGSLGAPSLKGFSNSGSLEPLRRTMPLTLDLNGNTIDRGLTREVAYGQVLRLNSTFKDSELYIKDGTIQGGYSSNQGGGILIQGDNIKLTLTDVIVTGNRSGSSGGGIFCGRCDSTLTLAGETQITGNESARQGGGIYLDWQLMGYMTVNLAGNIKVKDNKAANKNFRDIAMRGYAALNDVSGLTGGAEIGINNTNNTGGVIVSTPLDQPDLYTEYFTCSNAKHSIGVDGENQLVIRDTPPVEKILAKVTADGKVTDYTNIDTAWKEANSIWNTGREVMMTLCADWTVTSPITPSARRNHSTMTVNLGGHTIRHGQSGQGAIFDITNTGNFVIENGSLTGGSSGAIWFRGNTTNLTLDGMKIYGNTAANGGALYGDGTGTLYIKDSTITGNKGVSDSDGTLEAGGIYLSGSNLKVSLSGQVMIENNESAFKEQNDLVLGYGTLLSDISGLSKDSKIRVSIYPDGGGAFTPMDTAAKDPGCFESGDALFQVKQETDGDKSQLVLSQTGHVHIWNFEVKDATITAECSGESTFGQCTATDRELTIEAENQDYDGTPKGATLSAKTLAGQTVDENAIVYYVKGQEKNPIRKPSDAGTYVAKYTFVYRDTEYTVQKEYRINPVQQTIAAPTAKTVTDSSVELNAIAGGYGETNYGYSTENRAESVRNWQTGTTFSRGLAPATTYYFFARYAGDKNHEGIVSNGTKITTEKEKHVHNWKYTVSGTTITATCKNSDCDYTGNRVLTLQVPKNPAYDGTQKAAVLLGSDGKTATSFPVEIPDIQYENVGGTKYQSQTPPTHVGTYTASIKVAGKQVSERFTIAKKQLTVSGTSVEDKIYDSGTTATVKLGTVTGIVGGDKVTVTASGSFPNAEIGTYQVEVTYKLTGDDADNYIAPKGETCTASIKSKVGQTVLYNAPVYVNNDPKQGLRTMEERQISGYTPITQGSKSDVTLGERGKDTWYAVLSHVTISGKVQIQGNVNLIVLDSCELEANAGIAVNEAAGTLTIYSGALLTNGGIQGTGKVTATMTSDQKHDAAIGGEKNNSNGAITINGCTVYAKSFRGDIEFNFGKAAGIGGGGGDGKTGGGNGQNITINGGNVEAHGGIYGAGIGGGNNHDGKNIIINGGTVEAHGWGAVHGSAGIGGGDGGGCDGIIINGDRETTTVKAYGYGEGAGIGGGGAREGESSSGTPLAKNIVINGGTVTAVGSEKGARIAGQSGAGIGGGGYQCSGDITINGGTINATGGKDGGPGIGCGEASATDGDIRILGGEVTATGGNGGGAGIGGGDDCNGNDILISGQKTVVTATGGSGSGVGGAGAGIGGGYKGKGYNITIEGGATVTATGGQADGGAGIGGGEGGDASNITIRGENTLVTAVGSDDGGAGIGGGERMDNSGGNADNIKILDGATIKKAIGENDSGSSTDTGKNGGAGIGGGRYGSAKNITIKNATVKNATGGRNGGAGIGGGESGTGENITIQGSQSDVKAYGGTDGGAGIGGGEDRTGCNIYILGGKVEAYGGNEGGAGIGGGDEGDGHDFYIKKATVTATGGSGSGTGGAGAGIGGGYKKDGWNIHIEDHSVVTARGGAADGGAGIGGGESGAGHEIYIEGGSNVHAYGGEDAAGIGGGEGRTGHTIQVHSGSIVYAEGKGDGAGIGGGEDSTGKNMEFFDCTVTARGGSYSAGIGGGDDGHGTDITIRNATISAHSGESSASSGIGRGDWNRGETKNIRVYGCVVKAEDHNPPGNVVGFTDGDDIGGSINGKQFVEVTPR